jgi:hypothetical protein
VSALNKVVLPQFGLPVSATNVAVVVVDVETLAVDLAAAAIEIS